jgi:hypothetical protein
MANPRRAFPPLSSPFSLLHGRAMACFCLRPQPLPHLWPDHKPNRTTPWNLSPLPQTQPKPNKALARTTPNSNNENASLETLPLDPSLLPARAPLLMTPSPRRHPLPPP